MFSVGDIVWYIDPKEARVKVCKVIEEITKRTLDGEEKNYVFLLWAGREWKQVAKSRLNGDFYLSRDDAKRAMLNSAEDAINKMISRAESEAQELIAEFKEPEPEPIFHKTEVQQENTKDSDDDDVVKITLDDGTVARVRGL